MNVRKERKAEKERDREERESKTARKEKKRKEKKRNLTKKFSCLVFVGIKTGKSISKWH